jgi:hypothetical protein
MPSYFDTFGMPDMSIHMMNRLRERGISLAALSRALMGEPIPGTSSGTIIYREKAGGVSAIVNATTGRIITVWQE